MGTPDASTRLFLDEIALEVRQRLKVVSADRKKKRERESAFE